MTEKRITWRVVLIITAVFASGFVAGLGTVGGLGWLYLEPGAGMRNPEVHLNRMTKTLELTPKQQAAVEEILEKTRAEMMDLRREFKPRMRGALKKARGEISAVLNPAQRQKFDTIVERKAHAFKKMMRRYRGGTDGTGNQR